MPRAATKTKTATAHASSSQQPQIPSTGYLRLRQIIGDPKASPPVAPLIPYSRSTFLAGVRSGRFPAPVKFGGANTAAFWKAAEILEVFKNAQPVSAEHAMARAERLRRKKPPPDPRIAPAHARRPSILNAPR